MSDETTIPHTREGRDFAMIDETDRVDVASFDSFPASDPPAWIATGIGSTEPYVAAGRDAAADSVLPRISLPRMNTDLSWPRMNAE